MNEGGALVSVARTLIGLIGVCALAWVTLTVLARRGFGAPRGAARLKLLERLALGPRRALYLVQADSRVFLVGAGEAGTLSLISELEPSRPQPSAADASAPARDNETPGR